MEEEGGRDGGGRCSSSIIQRFPLSALSPPRQYHRDGAKRSIPPPPAAPLPRCPEGCPWPSSSGPAVVFYPPTRGRVSAPSGEAPPSLSPGAARRGLGADAVIPERAELGLKEKASRSAACHVQPSAWEELAGAGHILYPYLLLRIAALRVHDYFLSSRCIFISRLLLFVSL